MNKINWINIVKQVFLREKALYKTLTNKLTEPKSDAWTKPYNSLHI